VGPEGLIITVAGSGQAGFSGDGGPATEAQLASPSGVALGPDGFMYIADTDNHRIRRVGPDGTIVTVAGNGTPGFGGDNGPAARVQLHTPAGVAVSPSGRLYIADAGNHRIRQVTTAGIITTLAGDGTPGFGGDGGPATEAQLSFPSGVALGLDGALYLADLFNNRIRRVGLNGTISTVAGTGSTAFNGENQPAAMAALDNPAGIALGPEGNLYIADTFHYRVRRLAPALPSFALDMISVVSDDGREQYIFSSAGRHLRTEDTQTGATRYEFFYTNGRLSQLKDVHGNTTTIERDANGNPTAIVAPFGQRTTLRLDANDYLDRITNPAGEAVTFTYQPDGLMTDMVDARQFAYHFTYDAQGRLIAVLDLSLTRARTRSCNASTTTSLGMCFSTPIQAFDPLALPEDSMTSTQNLLASGLGTMMPR
jgi:YD repeat-containing protein